MMRYSHALVYTYLIHVASPVFLEKKTSPTMDQLECRVLLTTSIPPF